MHVSKRAGLGTMSFSRKVVLITEGTDGIGALTAELFAKEGASVAIVGINEAKLNRVVQLCRKTGAQILAIKADVAKDKETDEIVNKTIDEFGKLDVLINNAGIFQEAGILCDNFLKTYDEVTNINMRSVIRITYFAAPHLINSKGNIINVSSMAGLSTTIPEHVAYGISKAAMSDFTKSIALELSPHAVRVNTISSSPFRFTIKDGIKKKTDKMHSNMSLQQLSEPADVANLILYVASDKGKGITGSNLWRKPRFKYNTSG